MDNTPQEVPEETPLDTLSRLAEAAKLQRLSPSEEDHAVALLTPILASGGRSGITSVLETMVALPWIVSVNAVSAVWGDWTLVMRRHLLSGLAKIKTDPALRLRLSLARAIFKIDPPAALKIAAATLPDLLDEETGTLTAKHRQIFFNVLIGKGKPWLLQLPLADFKASEADTLIHCAIETFPFCPPLSQFSILRWTHTGGRFKKISETDLATIIKSVGRWNGKLQRQLKSEIGDLPEAITAVFKPAPATPPSSPSSQEAETAAIEPPAASIAPAEPLPLLPAPATPGEPATAAPEQESADEATAPKPSRRREREREDRRSKRDQKREPKRDQRDQRGKPRPTEEEPTLPEDEEDLTDDLQELQAIDAPPTSQTSETPESESTDSDETESDARRDRRRERDERRTERDRSRQKTAPFDFKDSLRGLETYISSLRNELEQTKAQLRRKEDEGRRGDRRRGEERFPIEVEALQKHNTRLEQTVADLRQQLEDLATHHEAIAESRGLHGDEPLPENSVEQLCKLLTIKLQEDYETYTAMRLEPLDRVFRLDYRDLLGHVFDVLIEQGVPLKTR